MTNEAHNVRVHDAGLLHWDWNYYTDVSIDQAYKDLNTGDGVDVAEVMDLLRSTTDVDQITHREARQLYGAFNAQWANMDQDARNLASKIMNKLDAAYPAVYVPPDLFSRGHGDPAPLLDQRDENYTSPNDGTNLQGDEMTQFVADMQQQADWVKTIRDIANAVGRI